jgi:hypothetical protein
MGNQERGGPQLTLGVTRCNTGSGVLVEDRGEKEQPINTAYTEFMGERIKQNKNTENL